MNNVVSFKSRDIDGRVQASGNSAGVGTVVLLGAGPGDPQLMTLKGLRALEGADVVVYDRLVNPEIVAMANPASEKIYVGKGKAVHSLPQERICQLLVSLALAGRNVVRLKGGDPLVFGRGGEEIDALEGAGVPWQVIPGITAATGCAATTGIPLTHRDCAHAVTFITAHRRHGELAFNWDLALQRDQTVVFYMGLSVAGDIARGLIARGKSADTPVAVVANGSRASQQWVVATLATLDEALAKTPLPSPALIILGEVVTRRATLLAVAKTAVYP